MVIHNTQAGIDICKKVGRVHLVVAVVSFLCFLVVLVLNQSASALLLVYFFVTGLLLYRGDLRAAQATAFLSALGAGLSIGLVFLLLLELPLGFLWASLKFNTLTTGLTAITTIGLPTVCVWAYVNLRHPSLLTALEDEMLTFSAFSRRPYVGFIIGAVLTVAVWGWWRSVATNDVRERATIEATKQLGENYQFVMTSLNIAGKLHRNRRHINASFSAYNENEMIDLDVYWSE